MIPLVEIPEQSFSNLKDLRDAIANQDRKVYEVPIRAVSLSEEGIVRAGRFEGRLTKPALFGLLNSEGIPLDFGIHRCPMDFLPTMVERLAREINTRVFIQTINGVAAGIMPADRQPIRHDVLLDRLALNRPIREAVLSADCLRITAADSESQEWLPHDRFGSGWELMTSETGWQPIQVWRWVVREICTNGLVGFDKAAVFKRWHNSREPVLVSMERLMHAIEHAAPANAQTGIRWSAEKLIGNEHEFVVSYLSRRLGDAIKQELGQVNRDSSWFDLMNVLTSSARLHQLGVRRRYEIEGGMLLKWFSQRGRTRPPWRQLACEGCEAWDAHSGEQNTSPSVESAQLSLFD